MGFSRYDLEKLSPEAKAHVAAQGVVLPGSCDRRHKYNATAVVVDGHRFPSLKEAKRYEQLKLLQRAGDIDWFLMQVPFHLPGGVKYLLDFLVKWADGRHTYEDVKGVKTTGYKLKKKQVESLYPGVIITEV